MERTFNYEELRYLDEAEALNTSTTFTNRWHRHLDVREQHAGRSRAVDSRQDCKPFILPYAANVGPNFQLYDSARPHRARIVLTFLEQY